MRRNRPLALPWKDEPSNPHPNREQRNENQNQFGKAGFIHRRKMDDLPFRSIKTPEEYMDELKKTTAAQIEECFKDKYDEKYKKVKKEKEEVEELLKVTREVDKMYLKDLHEKERRLTREKETREKELDEKDFENMMLQREIDVKNRLEKRTRDNSN